MIGQIEIHIHDLRMIGPLRLHPVQHVQYRHPFVLQRGMQAVNTDSNFTLAHSISSWFNRVLPVLLLQTVTSQPLLSPLL